MVEHHVSKLRWKPRGKPENPFVHRVLAIPIVQWLCQIAISAYQSVKQSNKVLHAVLQTVENCLNYVNQLVEPIKKILQKPVTAISKVADRILERLQSWFPIINTTPEQITDFGHNVYEKTGAKLVVQFIKILLCIPIMFVWLFLVLISVWVEITLSIVEGFVDDNFYSPDTKDINCKDNPLLQRIGCITGKVVIGLKYQSALVYNTTKRNPLEGIKEIVVRTCRFSLELLLLPFIIVFANVYIPLVYLIFGSGGGVRFTPENQTTSNGIPDGNSSQAQQISDLVEEWKDQVALTYTNTKQSLVNAVYGVSNAIKNATIGVVNILWTLIALPFAFLILLIARPEELFSADRGNTPSNQEAKVNPRNAALWIGSTIRNMVNALASGALYLVKVVTNIVADVSDYVVSVVSPYFPEGMQKPTATLLSYIHLWQERVQNAASAGDIWKAVVDEAKQFVRLAKQIIQTILNNDDTSVDTGKKRW